jgi:hypothetical protein
LHYVHYLTEIASFYEKYYDIARARESLEQVNLCQTLFSKKC